MRLALEYQKSEVGAGVPEIRGWPWSTRNSRLALEHKKNEVGAGAPEIEVGVVAPEIEVGAGAPEIEVGVGAPEIEVGAGAPEIRGWRWSTKKLRLALEHQKLRLVLCWSIQMRVGTEAPSFTWGCVVTPNLELVQEHPNKGSVGALKFGLALEHQKLRLALEYQKLRSALEHQKLRLELEHQKLEVGAGGQKN